jgi:hypothetical protein
LKVGTRVKTGLNLGWTAADVAAYSNKTGTVVPLPEDKRYLGPDEVQVLLDGHDQALMFTLDELEVI